MEDRISLLIESDSPEILEAANDFEKIIKDETLAEEIGEVPVDAHEAVVKIEGLEVKIYISKYLV